MLPGCLKSLEGQSIDRIIVIDGAYKDFPHTYPYSDDQTCQIAGAFGCEWIPAPAGRPWKDEVEKRNTYLVGEEGDWYFHIDADERLMGVLPEPKDGNTYWLHINHRYGSGSSWIPRLFQHKGDTRYFGAHHHLWRDQMLIWNEAPTRISREQAYLLHLSHLRPVDRQLDKLEWLSKMRLQEKPYRDAQNV
jgi:hypothetical protein